MTVAELRARLAEYDADAIVDVADVDARGNGLYYPIEKRLSVVGVCCNSVHNGKHTGIVITTRDTWHKKQ